MLNHHVNSDPDLGEVNLSCSASSIKCKNGDYTPQKHRYLGSVIPNIMVFYFLSCQM